MDWINQLNRRRQILLSLATLGFFAYVVYRGASQSSDFRHQYGAVRSLWDTGKLHLSAQPRYPVPYHIMFAPLSALPLGIAAAIWAALSFAATASLPGVLTKLTGIAARDQLVAWALVGPFFLDALVLGQSDPINFWLVAMGLVAVRGGQEIRGTWLVGLAGMIKMLPIVQWMTLLARRPTWRVAFGMALTVVTGFGLSAFFLGIEPTVAAFREQVGWLRENERPWHLVARGSDLRPNNESLPITLARTFGAIPSGYRANHVVALANLPLPWIWASWYAALAILSGLWLVAATRWSRKVDDIRGWLAMFALTSILMLATTPIAWHHYFLWILPAALFLRHRRRLLLSLAVVSLGISAWPEARGFGGHMIVALGLCLLVVYDLRQEANANGVSPREETHAVK